MFGSPKFADNVVPATAPSSAAGGDAATIDRKVEAEMTRLLYRQAGFGLFSNFVLAAILVAGTLSVHPASLHGSWFGAILVVSVARFALNLAYARANPSIDEHLFWRRGFLVSVAIAGLIWGSAGWFYFATEDTIPRLLLVCILVGLNAGAARSLASVPASYRIYVATTLGPLLLRFLTMPDEGAWTLDLITITYALFLLK